MNGKEGISNRCNAWMRRRLNFASRAERRCCGTRLRIAEDAGIAVAAEMARLFGRVCKLELVVEAGLCASLPGLGGLQFDGMAARGGNWHIVLFVRDGVTRRRGEVM